jgi:hypothetical protein
MPPLEKKRSVSDDILIGAVVVLVLVGAVSWFAGPSAGPPTPLLTRRTTATFTLGSTKGDVERIQGAPTSRGVSAWRFGNSIVYFREDQVVGWHVARGWGLRVKLATAARVSTGRFQVGSTKDEVAAVQGTPGALRNDVWQYGASKVYFRGGKVAAWSNPAAYPLKVQGASGAVPVAKPEPGFKAAGDVAGSQAPAR